MPTPSRRAPWKRPGNASGASSTSRPFKHTNETLISTLDEVIHIQEEGRQKRRAAEAELGRIEGELKQKLLEIRG